MARPVPTPTDPATIPAFAMDDTQVRARLAELEAIIEVGKQTFIEVGTALLEIRDSRLYRLDFETFETYCQQRHGFGRTYAHRLMSAAEVVTMLPIGNMPATESQARELAPLKDEPEKLRLAWQKATSDGRPTAVTVRRAVEEVAEREHTRVRVLPPLEPHAKRLNQQTVNILGFIHTVGRLNNTLDGITANIVRDPKKWRSYLSRHEARQARKNIIAIVKALYESDDATRLMHELAPELKPEPDDAGVGG